MFVSLLLCASASLPAQHIPAAPASTPQANDAASARAELVRGLLALAGWAGQNELYSSRDAAWRSVLALEPENADAHRGLRHTRDAQGHWKEPPAHESKDKKPALQAEFVRRRTELVSAWRTRVLEALEREKADRTRRDAACAEILRVDPEDAVVHGMLGEVRGEKSWLLAESVASATRRAELHKCVQDSTQAQVQADGAAASALDLGYLPAWKVARSCEGVRLLVQTSEEEARSLAQVQHSARALLHAICGKVLNPSQGFSAYVITAPADCEQFLAAVAEASADDKKNWKQASGFGIPHRAAAVLWDQDPKRRLDCFTRHLVANCLFEGFGLYAREGWVVEGLGLYLTHELVGTHETWFRPDQPNDDQALVRRLRDPQANWLVEAQTLCHGPNAPKLAELLAKPLGELSVFDMLAATAFAQYLVEALPKELPEILDRVGRSGQSAEAIAAVTGRPFAEIEKRFVRWLSEMP